MILISLPYIGELPWLPVQVVVDLDAMDIDSVQLGKGKVSPLRVLRVVEVGKPEKSVLTIKLSHVPITSTDEEMQANHLVLAINAIGFVELW